jgi:peroxiredoxin
MRMNPAMTEVLPGTALEKERVVPDIPMTAAASGTEVSLSDFRQRLALAVCFLHDGCEPCARYAGEFAESIEELRQADATAFVVLTEAASLDVPVLLDTDSRARRRFLGASAELPLVLIVDRFGAASSSFPSRDHAFPAPQEVVATLWHLALECPECGVSTW